MKIMITIIALCSSLAGLCQNNVFLGQYFKLMPVFAPGLTGANNFLDIKTGVRNQWAGYEGAPRTYFASVSGTVNSEKRNKHKYNSLRVDNMSPYSKKVTKIGLGGYVFDDRSGEFNQFELSATGAVHVSLLEDTYLSLGVTAGYLNTQLDVSNLSVLNPDNDLTYIAYQEGGYVKNQFKIATGLSVYSDQFYISYTIMNFNLISGSTESVFQTSPMIAAHQLLGGMTISAGENVQVIPNFYLRKAKDLPFLVDVGARIRYKQNPYIGMSYRSNKSVIALVGFAVNDMLDIGYSYESYLSNDNISNLGSHEVVLGIRLFNYGKYVPLW